MISQYINFEELHDSVIGDCYDFNYLAIKNCNRCSLEVIEKGQLLVDTITTNVITLNIIVKKKKIFTVYIYKDSDFVMNIMF